MHILNVIRFSPDGKLLDGALQIKDARVRRGILIVFRLVIHFRLQRIALRLHLADNLVKITALVDLDFLHVLLNLKSLFKVRAAIKTPILWVFK